MHMSLKPMLSTGNMSPPLPLPGAKSGLHVPPLQFIRWPWAIGLWGQWKKDILATNIWLVVFISNIVKGKYKGRLETENHQSNSILIGWHFHICCLNLFVAAFQSPFLRLWSRVWWRPHFHCPFLLVTSIFSGEIQLWAGELHNVYGWTPHFRWWTLAEPGFMCQDAESNLCAPAYLPRGGDFYGHSGERNQNMWI